MSERLRKLLIKHEGLRLKPYLCPAKKLTIGVGRNLDDVGISEAEAMFLLQNDIERALDECHARFPWFYSLDEVRQDVILSMVFNLGITRFLGFRKLITAMAVGDYALAGAEMLSSRWAVQVGPRAKELADMMFTGKDA